jgi:hypothetical protein
MNHKTFLIACLVFLEGCATGHRSTSQQLRELVEKNRYAEAINYLNQGPLAADEKSALLYHLELGMLYHLRGDYSQSSKAFTRARDLVDELFTTRISGKFTSSVANDNADFYYGEMYEASLVHFYLALNAYLEAQREPEEEPRTALLRKARAEVVAWDSFLTELRRSRYGKAIFKDDLLAKTFGAVVHEAQGNRTDDQIALQLYRDAKELLFQNYNALPTFNHAFQEFKDNFELLPQLGRAEVEGRYVRATPHYSAFLAFLESKITAIAGPRNRGVTILFQEGLIAPKVSKVHEYPIDLAAVAHGHLFGIGNRVRFELPYVEPVRSPETVVVTATDGSKAVVAEAPLTVIAPLSDLAVQAINEHAAAVAAKTGARLAAKHLAAVLAGQAIAREGSMTALVSATVAHTAAIVAINESERADTRFWSTLPGAIRMAHLNLPDGSYDLRLGYGPNAAGEVRLIELGTITTSAGRSLVTNHRPDQSTQAVVAATPPGDRDRVPAARK